MFGLKHVLENFDKLRLEVYDKYDDAEIPSVSESLSYFSRCFFYLYKLIFKEKEIITFAALHFICVCLGYYSFVALIDWIHDVGPSNEAFRTAGYQWAGYLLIIYVPICFIIITICLGILSSFMGAAYFLHKKYKESTIVRCLYIVLIRSWYIFLFCCINSCWKIGRIKNHIPLKMLRNVSERKNSSYAADRWMREAVYQAWKVASIGLFPALIVGRSIKNSCKDSSEMLKTHFNAVSKIEMAYSTLCWWIYISSYIFVPLFVSYIFPLIYSERALFQFFFPLMFASFFIQVFLKPIYILSACRIYLNYANETNIKFDLPKVSSFFEILILFLIIGVVFLKL